MSIVGFIKKITGISQHKQIFLSLVLGLLAGFVLKEHASHLRILGDIFLKMIKMTIAPLIFVSVTHVFSSMSGKSKMGMVAFKSVMFYKIATVVSASFGIFASVILQPGHGISISAESIGAKQVAITNKGFSLSDMILHVFPDNVFDAFLRGDIIQILVFATFFGIAVSKLSPNVNDVVVYVDSLSKIVFKLVEIVIKFTPIGIFGIMAYMAGTQDLKTLRSLFYLILLVYGCGFVVAYIFYGLVIVFFGLNPIPFFKKVFEVQAFAFLTSSSAASIPLAKSVAEKKMGVTAKTASLAVPLGGAFNMSGTALHLGITSVFLAQVYGANLVFGQYVQILVLSMMLTMGAVGIPSASLLMMPMILVSIGVPAEYVAVYVGVDRFLDMLRSSLNATGDVLAAVVIDKSENTLDIKTYNS